MKDLNSKYIEPTEKEREMLAKFLSNLKESDYASEKELRKALK